LLGVLGALFFQSGGDVEAFSPRIPLIVGAVVALLLVAVVVKRIGS
jgi:hypothetical protein